MQCLYANGLDATTGGYLSPPMTATEWLQLTSPEAPVVARAPLPDIDADDLAQAGWGWIAPPGGLGKDLRGALAPLLERRRAQAGERFRELEYRPGDSWLRFLGRQGAGPGQVNPGRLPYYLLIVASPQQIPFELQYQLDVQYAVGRLWFDSAATADPAAACAAYVRGLLDCEDGAVRRPRNADAFVVRNWDDPATAISLRHLGRPVARALQQRPEGWRLRTWSREETTKARLVELLADSSLLFTAGHAVRFRPQDELHASDQGALLCYDWPGPEDWQRRIPPDWYFAARDVPDSADLRGLITLHFACYSAGSPRWDAFHHLEPREPLRIAAEPFVAALPQRLLGHPNGGALGVIGHVDRAWEHGFQWQGAPQAETFETALRELMKGRRLGHALESFGQRYADLARATAAPETPEGELGEPSPEEQAYLAMARNDARSYVLLGDPAARLCASEAITETAPAGP